MRRDEFKPHLGAVLVAVAIGGCGGDGAGGSSAGSGSHAAQLSGAIVKGPVAGAQVCAYEASAAGKGRQLACTTSSADGSYDLSLEHRGPVIVEATGGTYTDEATGTPAVALATPLGTFGEVKDGTTTLVATPLTTMAMNVAERSGTLSLAAFDGAAQQVKTAFGLGGDVDLARSRPDVSPGSADAYGRALVGLSRMLKAGASLPQVLAATDFVAIKAAFETCLWVGPDPVVEIVSGTTVIPRPGGPNASIDVFVPTPAWRTTLPTTGPLGTTGCVVLENTADRVRMSCDPTTPRAAVTIRTGSAATNGNYESTPTSSELTLAGARIVISGGELLTGAGSVVTLDAPNGTVQMGLYCQLTPAAAIVPRISGGGLILTNNGGPVPVIVPAGTVSLSGGTVSINGTLQGPGQVINWSVFEISSSEQIHFAQASSAGLSMSTPAGTISLAGGSLSISGTLQGPGPVINRSAVDLSSAGQIQVSQGSGAVPNMVDSSQDPVIGVLGSSAPSGQAATLF